MVDIDRPILDAPQRQLLMRMALVTVAEIPLAWGLRALHMIP